MAIQNRRGNYIDLDKSQLVPGEFAVVLDQLKLLLCFAAGSVEEIPLNKNTLSYKAELSTNDLNAVKSTGIYSQATSSYATAARHYPATGAGTLLVIAAGSTTTRIQQYYMPQNADELYYRRYASSIWSDWAQLYPAEQSGSNEYGRWIRFPDGTQICWIHKRTTVLESGGISVQFPQPFVDNTYSATAGVSSPYNLIANCDNASPSATSVWFYNVDTGESTAGVSVLYSVMAIGRYKE